MAQRKITLADIEGPKKRQSQALPPTGRVQLPRVTIRQGGYRPEKDVFNFKALSQTVGKIAALAGDAWREDQEDEARAGAIGQLAGKRMSFRAEMQQEGGPLHSLEGPAEDFDPAQFDEFGERLRVPLPEDAPPPGLPAGIETTVPLPPHLQEQADALAEATRRGWIPPMTPLTSQANAQTTGESAASAAKEAMAARFNTDTRIVDPITGATETSVEDTLKQAYWRSIQANPVLDRESPAASMRAIKAFEMNFLRLARDYKSRVFKAWMGNSAGAVVRQVIAPRVREVMEMGLDARIDARHAPGQTEETWSQSTADALNMVFQRFHKTGLPIDMPTTQVALMRAELARINRAHPEDKYEREEQLRLAMEVFKRVKLGTVDAEKDFRFDAVEADYASFTQNGGSRNGSLGHHDYHDYIARAADEAVADLQKTMRDQIDSNNAGDLVAIRLKGKTLLEAKLDKDGVQGVKRREILRQADSFWDAQLQPHGFKFYRQAVAKYKMEDIFRRAVMGDIPGALGDIDEAFVSESPIFDFDTQKKIRDRVLALDKIGPHVGPGTSFYETLERIRAVGKQLTDKKLPADIDQSLRVSQADFIVKMYSRAQQIARTSEDTEADIEKEFSGAGGMALEIKAFESTRTEKLKDVAKARVELADLTQKMTALTPAQKEGFRARLGEIEATRAFIANEARRNVNNVINRMSSATSTTLSHIRTEVSTFYRQKEGVATAETASLRNLRVRELNDGLELDFRRAQRTLTREFKGGEGADAKLEADWNKKAEELIKTIPQRVKDLELLNEDALKLRKAKVFTEDKGATVRLSVDDYEVGMAGAFDTLMESIGYGVLKGGLFQRAMRSRRFGSHKERSKATRDWEIHRGNWMIENIEGLPPVAQYQAKYELYSVDGKIHITDVERGRASVETLSSKSVFPFGTIVSETTDQVDLSRVKINKALPLFRTAKEVDDFAKDFERVWKVAERLGFKFATTVDKATGKTVIDKTKSPIEPRNDTQTFILWLKTQKSLAAMQGRYGR